MSDIFKILQRTASGLSGLGEFAPAIVGSVDEGAIIEHGSNVNGEYIKLADGTMWCWHSAVDTVDIIAPVGSLYYNSGGKTLQYPATFYNVPSFWFSVYDNAKTAKAFLAGGGNIGSKSLTPVMYILRPVAAESVSVRIDYLALGRWK